LIPRGLSEERALPSKGLRLNQIQAVFGALGQPGLFYGFSSLPDVEGVLAPTPRKDSKTGENLPGGHWDTRCISIICRYLNSGFPVLVAGKGHALVLVGWRRAPNGRAIFVACDEQVGPYEEIPSPFGHYRAPWHSIVVPLPPKVFLTGEAAENDAYETLRGVWTADTATKPLADALAARDVQLRTSLKHVNAFKREISEQTSSDEVLCAVRLSRLPHFLWVVEAHLRVACGNGDCVMATLLYDATSSDYEPRQCIIAVPGAVGVFDPDPAAPNIVPAGLAPWQSMLNSH
jgi:hypothetical protein